MNKFTEFLKSEEGSISNEIDSAIYFGCVAILVSTGLFAYSAKLAYVFAAVNNVIPK